MRCRKPHLVFPYDSPLKNSKSYLCLCKISLTDHRTANYCMPYLCSRRILVKNAYFAAGVPHQSHVTGIDQ